METYSVYKKWIFSLYVRSKTDVEKINNIMYDVICLNKRKLLYVNWTSIADWMFDKMESCLCSIEKRTTLIKSNL